MVATAPATMIADQASVGARRQDRTARTIAAVATRAGQRVLGSEDRGLARGQAHHDERGGHHDVPTRAPAKASDILKRAARPGELDPALLEGEDGQLGA